jgi:hypothetical protein
LNANWRSTAARRSIAGSQEALPHGRAFFEVRLLGDNCASLGKQERIPSEDASIS